MPTAKTTQKNWPKKPAKKLLANPVMEFYEIEMIN
jgi:phosphoribosylformylglycinamidine (FGAM) synthase PurS component